HHVSVVEMAGAGAVGHIRRLSVALSLSIPNSGQALPGIGDVAGGAPGVAADLGTPIPNVAPAVLAETEDDVAIELVQSVVHDLVRLFERGNVGHLRPTAAHRVVGTPIVFQVVETPIGKALGVLLLVLPTGRAAAAGRGAGAGIDPRLQAQRM